MLRWNWAQVSSIAVPALVTFALLITLPAYREHRQRRDLESAASTLDRRLAWARAAAVSTGQTHTVVLANDHRTNSSYRILRPGSSAGGPAWKLPSGVTYLWAPGTSNRYRMTSDGRCWDAGPIILRDRRGRRDTVRVRFSLDASAR